MQKRLPLILLALATLLPFQNCTFVKGVGQPTAVTKSSGGQPYDGKPFVVGGVCPDGTIVQSRIMYENGKGTLYRENCQTMAPRPLSDRDIRLDRDTMIYNGRTYQIERPSIPLPGVISWFLQLTGILQSRPAAIYVVDMFDNDAASINSLKSSRHTVICDISAGTVESWNPDASSFLTSEIGNRMAQGERWIDTRSSNVRAIMVNRIRLAAQKGCHGVSFAAADGFVNSTGFPLTADTQLEYNRYLAFAAHDHNLILSLSNVPELAAPSSVVFDFAIAEQCFEFNECESYLPFIAKGKPVLAVEYGPVSAAACARAESLLLSLSFMSSSLDGSRYETCN